MCSNNKKRANKGVIILKENLIIHSTKPYLRSNNKSAWTGKENHELRWLMHHNVEQMQGRNKPKVLTGEAEHHGCGAVRFQVGSPQWRWRGGGASRPPRWRCGTPWPAQQQKHLHVARRGAVRDHLQSTTAEQPALEASVVLQGACWPAMYTEDEIKSYSCCIWWL
jgi:hypothetical protein